MPPPDPRPARFDRAHTAWAKAWRDGSEHRAAEELERMRQLLVWWWDEPAEHERRMPVFEAAEKSHRARFLVPLVPADEARRSMWHA